MILLFERVKMKIKENKKTDNHLNLTIELKKIMTHVNDSDTIWSWYSRNSLPELEEIVKKNEIRGRIKTLQTKVLLRLVKIFRRVLETRKYLLSIRFQWKTNN